MAYLRGRSFVDGDLVVAGTLQVRNIVFSDEEIRFYALDSGDIKESYLVQFYSEDGALGYSPFKVTTDLSQATLLIDKPLVIGADGTGSALAYTIDQIKVYDRGLKLSGSTWVVDNV